MGPPERLKLSWTDFEANARVSLMKLREETEFNDVTVVADCGKQVEANKMVLAGGSSFFHKILKENPHPHPLIYLKGVSYKHLVYLLDFVYTGETSIVEDDLNDFLDIAQDLKVKGLTLPGTLEPCLSPKVSHPSHCGTSSTPAPQQDQAAGMLNQSRPQGMTSTCHAEEVSTPEVTQLHTVKFDLPHDQVAAKVTSPSLSVLNPHSLKSAPHEYKVIAENRVQPCRLPSSRSGQLLAAEEKSVQALGLQHPKSAMSSHLNNAFSQDPCEEDHDNTCLVKVEVGDAQHYNIAYNVNDHGEASISHVSIRGPERNEGNINFGEDIEGIVLSAEQDQNGNVISKEEIMESVNDKVIREAAEVVFEDQMPHDWYKPGEEIDNMILGIDTHDETKMIPDGEKRIADETKSPEDADYQCLLCPITFTTSSQFRRHQKSHMNKKYSETSSQMGSSNKLKRIHAGVKPHKCVQCPKTFSRQSHLKLHNMTHTGEKPHKCVQCPKTFFLLSSLKRHKMIKHTGEKRHQCVECPKTFSELGKLKRHKIIHTGEKPHKCDLCNKSFNLLSNLKRHEIIHTGEKPYQCDLCSKSFSQLDTLKQHKMTKKHKRAHCDEKPY